jgi:hypothetical protein
MEIETVRQKNRQKLFIAKRKKGQPHAVSPEAGQRMQSHPF